MLETFDMYGIVDIRSDEQNAQIYYDKDESIWEMFLSNGSMGKFDNKQDAVTTGTNWVTRR